MQKKDQFENPTTWKKKLFFPAVPQLHPLLQAEPVNTLNLPSLSQHEGYSVCEVSAVSVVLTTCWECCYRESDFRTRPDFISHLQFLNMQVTHN